MEHITNLLYWLSTGLMIPVTLFLLFFFVRSLIMIGGFYGHYLAFIAALSVWIIYKRFKQ